MHGYWEELVSFMWSLFYSTFKTNPYLEHAIILEFKGHKPERKNTLEDTINAALTQSEEKDYATDLIAKGILKERIHCYGFAFEGSTVLIG